MAAAVTAGMTAGQTALEAVLTGSAPIIFAVLAGILALKLGVSLFRKVTGK